MSKSVVVDVRSEQIMRVGSLLRYRSIECLMRRSVDYLEGLLQSLEGCRYILSEMFS